MKKIRIKAHLRNYLICLEDVLGDKLETRMIGDKLHTGIEKMKQAKKEGVINHRKNIKYKKIQHKYRTWL